ncbi:MAG: phosphotransferase [bacterium]
MPADGSRPDREFRDAVAALLALPPDALRFMALSGGVSSDIWRVDTPRGPYCAKRALPRLRVAALWEAPVSRNAEEVRWLRTTRAWVGEQVAEVVAHDPSAGIAVLAWYDPSAWRNWKTELLAGRVDAAAATALGTLLGTIVRCSAAAPHLAADFANDHLFDALRIDPFFRHIRERHPPVAALVARLESDRRVLVHGDFSPKNVLVNAAHELRVLDAETAAWGCPGFDAGYLLAHLLLKRLHTGNRAVAAAAQGFWQAFQGAAGGGFDDLEEATRLVIGGMLLARVDGKSPVEYLSATEQAAVRERARALLERPAEPPGASVAGLIDDWNGALDHHD